ncbi:ATP-binding protein [Mycolicibacterium goodii]|uniref:ATP-binding protein n=1 Tax=Mycolicibacterium goodii TaxID=134601 RepID=UPI0018EC2483|nr:ATP-binding protein [Mycolicibacterium goodii]
MAEDAVIDELNAAVERSPELTELRLHLATLLVERERYAEALTHCSAVLARDATNSRAVVLLQTCTSALASSPSPSPPSSPERFDWSAAEQEVADIVKPAFVEEPPQALDENDFDAVRSSGVRLSDIAGMADVKTQLELSLLGPIRNPELMKAFKFSARGGLLLYGPPGCGKTFIAKAVSGELGANFYQVGIADVLSRWLGESERAVRAVFDTARRKAPCVLFFDEVDALGHRRSALGGGSGLRPVVNTLLEEMDSATSSNDGVYVLGATNTPWDVDVALRRPGRFDRMIFVPLPDSDARAAIVRLHLQDRPVEGINLAAIVKRTDGFSGADLAHVCHTATQLAMSHSLRTGQVRPVQMHDIDTALGQIRPSAGAWFDTARNVVEFGNRDGAFDDLANYLRRRKIR